ncbi:MAG: DUF1624 domain-containing protein [Proteobacteria bacterium]|nr:DUF1624 domain-containing protein [Pseudomonadota bacterium]MCL2306976.1 DUF1624 domain-containing protein [Pseudomonadota bacterium]
MNKEKTAVAHRLPWLDISRGLALWAMIVYHFCFDLQWFGVIKADFYRDPFWTTTRTLIITSFLLIVGISLFVARARDISARSFWLRVAKITACALIVSIATSFLFRESYIYFGVLHFIAIASILAWPFAAYPRLALISGIIVVLAGITFSHPLFDTRALSIIGFVTTLPRTEDYVPIFPWLGVVLIGIGVAPSLPIRKAIPASPTPTARLLTWMGQRSLWIYMLHQPILIAALWCVLAVLR